MPAPSKAWVPIADSQVDAESPLDTTLMTGIRDNLVHLKEWIGDSFTSAKNHDHNGVNSAYTNISINVVRTFDDFLDPNISEWTKTGTVTALAAGVNGVCNITAGSAIWAGLFQTGLPWKLSGPTIMFETTVKTVDATSNTLIGLSADDSGSNNYVAFRRIDSGANWRCLTASGGVSTNTDSGVAITTGAFVTLKIVATPTSVAFYVNDALVSTNTTNIPTTTNMGIAIKNYGTATIQTDYVHCYTTSRM